MPADILPVQRTAEEDGHALVPLRLHGFACLQGPCHLPRRKVQGRGGAQKVRFSATAWEATQFVGPREAGLDAAWSMAAQEAKDECSLCIRLGVAGRGPQGGGGVGGQRRPLALGGLKKAAWLETALGVPGGGGCTRTPTFGGKSSNSRSSATTACDWRGLRCGEREGRSRVRNGARESSRPARGKAAYV